MFLITLYLVAIIVANLVTAYFGPNVSIINAFLFIGLDLTSRDRLHEVWHNNGLLWKMALLIATGSAISWFLNRNAGPVALASFAAFGAAAVADTLVYQWLNKRPYLVKVNGSNIVSSLVDSMVFPTLAFGGFTLWITAGQFAAKFVGGFIWSLILRKR
jgi:hypothetical protein